MDRFSRWFPGSAGVLLAITALAKLVSALGTAEILQRYDPVLRLSYQRVFFLAAAMELVVVFICFSRKTLQTKSGAIAWLATLFLIYRLGLWWANYPAPCKCLGNLTDALHISPELAGTISKVILAYLLVGSYAILFRIWRSAAKISPVLPSTDTPPTAS
jgi:hypothetical protein